MLQTHRRSRLTGQPVPVSLRSRARLERLETKLDVVAEDDEDDPHLLDGSLATKDLPPQHGG